MTFKSLQSYPYIKAPRHPPSSPKIGTANPAPQVLVVIPDCNQRFLSLIYLNPSSNMANSNAPSSPPKASAKPKASSTKAHNGSSKSGNKSSHNHSSSSHIHSQSPHRTAESDERATVRRFIFDERDHRSLVVKEFDGHQQEARKKHEEVLRIVVGKRYG